MAVSFNRMSLTGPGGSIAQQMHQNTYDRTGNTHIFIGYNATTPTYSKDAFSARTTTCS